MLQTSSTTVGRGEHAAVEVGYLDEVNECSCRHILSR